MQMTVSECVWGVITRLLITTIHFLTFKMSKEGAYDDEVIGRLLAWVQFPVGLVDHQLHTMIMSSVLERIE